MSRLAPKIEVIRALFALSGNQCAFPGCNHPLISDKGTFIGQVCHIEAASVGGQRYNKDQSPEQRRSQDNLVLLCYPHHRETDDEDVYTVEKLKEMKIEHEAATKPHPYDIQEIALSKAYKLIEQDIEKLLALSQENNSIGMQSLRKLDILLERTSQKSVGLDDSLKQQLNSIVDLYKQRKYFTGLDLLLKFKIDNWANFTEELKYKVQIQLGMFYLELNDKEKAVDCFLNLADIDFNSTDRLTYLALGYSLKGEYSQFDQLFERIRTANINSINLWVAFIQRHRNNNDVEYILANIPDEIADTLQIASNLALLLIGFNKSEKALQILQKAFSIHSNLEDICEVKGIVGSKLLHFLTIPEKFLFQNYSESEFELLRTARDMLSSAWELVKTTELSKSRFYLLVNRGTANRLLGDFDQALFDFKTAYDISHDFLPFQGLLGIFFQTKNYSQAEFLLDNAEFDASLTFEQSIELILSRSRLQVFQGDKALAISSLQLELTTAEANARDVLLPELIAISAMDGQNDLAETYCHQLIQLRPKNIIGYFLLGNISQNKNSIDEALRHYKDAFQLVDVETSIHEVIRLAECLSALGSYDEAIQIYLKFADKNILSKLTKGLIKCFFASGDLQAAHAIADNLNQNYPFESYLVDVLSDIYQETKQIEKALDILEQYINNTSQAIDDVLLLKAARLAILLQQFPKAQNFALKITNTRSFNLHAMFLLASILVEVGCVSQGMDIALEARERFINNSEAHKSFMSVCVSSQRKEDDVFPKAVKENCAVILINKAGEKKTFLITDKNITGPKVATSESLAKELLGLGIGAKITLQLAYGVREEVIVSEIKDLTTYAFQESVSFFKDRFAGQQQIGVFEFDQQDPFGSMMKILEATNLKQKEFEKQAYEFYERGTATLGVLAGLFRRNSIEQWYSVVQSSDISFFAYQGDESTCLLNAVDGNSSIIVDLTALLTWFVVLKQDVFFPSVAGEYIVAQSTIDELQNYVRSIDGVASSGRLSVGLENGKVVSNFTAEDVFSANQKLIREIIVHVKASAKIQIPNSLIEIKRGEREQKDKILGSCFYDTLLLAEEHNGAVLSDDQNFRRLIRHDGLRGAFSCYELQSYLEKVGNISADQLEQVRYDLIEANYTYIPSTADQIWMNYNNSEFKISKPFTTAVQGLLIVIPEFAAACLAKVFKKLFLNSGLVLTRIQTVIYILNEMTRRADFGQVKVLLMTELESEFLLLPQHKNEILALLKNY